MSLSVHSLRPNMLELPRRVQEVVRISLRRELPLIGLLQEVLVPLLLGKEDGVLLGLEAQVRTLHVVARGLPAHKWVLPPVALGQDIPVHPPLLGLPVAGLRRGLGGHVDAYRTRLQLHGSPGEDSCGEGVARLGAVEDTLGDGGERAVRQGISMVWWLMAGTTKEPPALEHTR